MSNVVAVSDICIIFCLRKSFMLYFLDLYHFTTSLLRVNIFVGPICSYSAIAKLALHFARGSEIPSSKLQGISPSRQSSNARASTALGILLAEINQPAHELLTAIMAGSINPIHLSEFIFPEHRFPRP